MEQLTTTIKDKKIPGGYYIKARKIQHSKIAHAPPYIREIWDWLLRNAHHTNGSLKRGQCLCSYKQIQEDLCWYVGYRKEKYSKWQCENAIKWLRERAMITTTRTTRGLIVQVVNYDFYQDPKNYEITTRATMKATAIATTRTTQEERENVDVESKNKVVDDHENDTENHNESHTRATMLPHYTKECNKNEKNINNNTDTSTKYLTKCEIPDVEFCNLSPEHQKKALDLIVSMHFRKFPYKKSPASKIYGKNGWIKFRVRVREYFEGIFAKYPTLSPQRVIKAIGRAKKEEPWKYYPPERANKERYVSEEEAIAHKKPDKKDLEILREAKKSLEVCSNEEKILYWLKKLPRALHGNLAVHLSKVYPDGHSYDKAKIRYEREKEDFEGNKNVTSKRKVST